MGLGDMFPGLAQPSAAPQPSGAPAPNPASPELKGQWDSWLSNPVNKAALLGFGIQAMAGGWGSGTQQLASALGAGAESGAGAAAVQGAEEDRIQKQKNIQMEESGKNTRNAADIAGRADVAGILSKSREGIAAAKPRNAREQALYNSVLKPYTTPTASENWKLFNPDATAEEVSAYEEQLFADGVAAAEKAVAASQAQFGVGSPGQTGGAQSAPGVVPETGSAVSNQPNGASQSGGSTSLDALKAKYPDLADRIDAMGATPEGRAKLGIKEAPAKAKAKAPAVLGSATNPFPSEKEAGFAQSFKGPDGKVYYKSIFGNRLVPGQ